MIHGNNFLKFVLNMGVLHFQTHFPGNIFDYLETNTLLEVRIVRTGWRFSDKTPTEINWCLINIYYD